MNKYEKKIKCDTTYSKTYIMNKLIDGNNYRFSNYLDKYNMISVKYVTFQYIYNFDIYFYDKYITISLKNPLNNLHINYMNLNQYYFEHVCYDLTNFKCH